MDEPKFKDYKEKQRYYRNKTKEEKFMWVSTDPRHKKGNVIKGRTYVKPKGIKVQ